MKSVLELKGGEGCQLKIMNILHAQDQWKEIREQTEELARKMEC
jgi:hypothetical protein